jgi:hypothetical protein
MGYGRKSSNFAAQCIFAKIDALTLPWKKATLETWATCVIIKNCPKLTIALVAENSPYLVTLALPWTKSTQTAKQTLGGPL